MSASMLPPISSLPPEIIEAILFLLPLKPLSCFKCVSKTWNLLISDPQFIKSHLQRHQTTTKLILASNSNSLLYSLDTNQLLPYLLNDIRSHNNEEDDDDYIHATVKELSLELSFRCKEIMGSCNGLVLERSINAIGLTNPTTQERWGVPHSPYGIGSVKYGFGYDSSTDDYKVVAMCSLTFGRTLVSVYSLRNNSWKKLPNYKPYGFYPLGSLPVVVNENVHWLSNSSTIVSFSCTTEGFNKLSLQDLVRSVGRRAWIYDLVDISGKLGVLIVSVEYSEVRAYELWVMEDYGVDNSWTKVCCLESRGRVMPEFLVLGSNRGILLHCNNDINVVFNTDEKKCRNVKIDDGSFGGFNVLGTYVESLESPKRILTAP